MMLTSETGFDNWPGLGWKQLGRDLARVSNKHSRSLKLYYLNSVLNVKAVVATFNQEKALVGAFSVITNLRMELFEALIGILTSC